jgi:hypothetical protein
MATRRELIKAVGVRYRQSDRPGKKQILTEFLVAAFTVLPILRLVFMLLIFFRQRDYCYTLLIAALVLLIVGVGCAAGVLLGPVAG